MANSNHVFKEPALHFKNLHAFAWVKEIGCGFFVSGSIFTLGVYCCLNLLTWFFALSCLCVHVCVCARVHMCVYSVACPVASSSLWSLGTVALQAPLSMGFSWQEYWSELPCLPPRDLPDPGIEFKSLISLGLAGGFFTTSAAWETPLNHQA